MLVPCLTPCLSWVNYILKLVHSALAIWFSFPVLVEGYLLSLSLSHTHTDNISILLVLSACFSKHHPGSFLPYILRQSSRCPNPCLNSPCPFWPASCLDTFSYMPGNLMLSLVPVTTPFSHLPMTSLITFSACPSVFIHPSLVSGETFLPPTSVSSPFPWHHPYVFSDYFSADSSEILHSLFFLCLD